MQALEKFQHGPGLLALVATGSALLSAQAPPAGLEQPIALIVSSLDGEVYPEGQDSGFRAAAGGVLFPGDRLRAGDGGATFLFCPEKAEYTLAAGTEVAFSAEKVRTVSGEASTRGEAALCSLPPLPRGVTAARFHNGGSLSRDLLEQEPPATEFAARVAGLPADSRAALAGELAAIDAALERNPESLPARVARAALFDRYGLSIDARAEYRAILAKWPDAVWAGSRLFVHDEAAAEDSLRKASAGRSAGEGGTSYALLVGVSDYQNPRINPLRFAHEDALLFRKHLLSERGGALAEENVHLLINEQATTSAVRLAFDALLKAQAGPDDTVLVFVASHGTVDPTTREGFIVTYDSDPQDLAATGLPMADLQELVQTKLATVGRVLIYVDVCHAGTIGTIRAKGNRINSVMERLGEADGEIVGFMASRPREVSYEGPQYGGGHGAFSYFLLNGLNGAADYDQDGDVNISDLIDYVESRVEEGTYNRQHPRDFGVFDNDLIIADLGKPGVEIPEWTGVAAGGETAGDAAGRSLSRRSIVPPAPPIPRGRRDLAADIRLFQDAVENDRLLPGERDNAFQVLGGLRRSLPKPRYLEQSNLLRAALEIKGQQVLLRYLQGDQIPKTREDFLAGAAYLEQAKVLTPESLLLEARAAFCLGRVAIFDKDYPRARTLLERAAKLDPAGAYSFNALGIAYLEQADYERAAAAFRDAIRRAGRWAYPYHNLALTYLQRGDYTNAVATYGDAIEQAPDFAYLSYNLGLVYQKLNRGREAEKAFIEAERKAANLDERTRARHTALARNARGYSKAAAGKARQAEQLYREALGLDEGLLEARHNLAVLLSGSSEGRFEEALGLWRENLSRDPAYLPSRLSLARALERVERFDEATVEYERVVELQPGYSAARLRLADLYLASQNAEKAGDHLEEARKAQPGNARVHEKIGDALTQSGDRTRAEAAYRRALERSSDKKTRKRIRRKLRE